MPRVVMISDTHGYQDSMTIPDGDILVHAGDLTKRGSLGEIAKVNEALGRWPHAHKVIIAGNHDFAFQQEPDEARSLITNATYLQDEEVTCMGLRIYGSPWQPRFHNWAFNRDRGADIAQEWAKIPSGLDILITHGPPYGIGDLVIDGRIEGCVDLLKRVLEVRPRYHLFGHIHESAGIYQKEGICFINAACCAMRENQPLGPFVFDIDALE